MRGSLSVAVQPNTSGFVWSPIKRPNSLFSLLTHRSQCCCMPAMVRHLLLFHLMMDDVYVLHVCLSGILTFVCSVWYVNAMLIHRANQAWATWRRGWRFSVSHVTSARACQMCQSSSDAEPQTCVEQLNGIWHSFSSFLSAEDSVSCENPGLPDNGYQILSKRLYLPGESLTFVCYQGYELIGEAAIKCILGNPSFWSGPLPLCRGKIFNDFCHFSVCVV